MLFQVMKERSGVRAIPGWNYSKSWESGWRESYNRVIWLHIMRERGVVRAIPGWYYSKSWGKGVSWELFQDDITLNDEGDGVSWKLYQDDITLNHEGEGCRESYSRMISPQIIRERVVVRAMPGWYYSKSWGRGAVRSILRWYYSKSWGRWVSWELYQDDITPNHEGEWCGEIIPGWYYYKS